MSSDPWITKMNSKVESKPLAYPEWRSEKGVLFKFVKASQVVVHDKNSEWKEVVSKLNRVRVLRECHDNPLAGHVGVRKTFARVGAR